MNKGKLTLEFGRILGNYRGQFGWQDSSALYVLYVLWFNELINHEPLSPLGEGNLALDISHN